MWDFLPFGLLHTTSTIIFYSTHRAISMAHAHVLHESWKKLKHVKKYEPIAWLKPGLCMMGVFCVMKMKHSLTIWFCRDELSMAMLFCDDIVILISVLEVLLFLCQYELLSWIFWIWIFIPQLRRFTLKLCQSITPHQKFFFIIYLLEDEHELSLGMPDTSPMYL